MDRIKVLQVALYIIAAVIITRLLYWQFIADKKLSLDSLLLDSEIPAARGEIYASDGFPLVANQEAFLLYIKPAEIEKNTKELASMLAPHLIGEKFATIEGNLSDEEEKEEKEEIDTKKEEIEDKLSNKNLLWLQLARKISKSNKEEIEKQKIEGLGFERDEKRFYPEASMAARLLGFVGSDKFGRDTGYFGLEGYWDLQLRGKNGQLGQEKDPLGLPILIGSYRPISPQKGQSLHTSIDRTIQFMVEEKLSRAVEQYGAKDGSVVIMDPTNGDILAMATYPSYTPALRTEFDEQLYKNPVVADTFEPGSIFKPIVMASALDVGAVEPNTKCTICFGPLTISGYEISTWNKKYFPDSTMTEVIVHSDNIGMSFTAQKMGISKFHNYIDKFGFGKRTGIDLQEETPGQIRSIDNWKEIDLTTASFGQGIGTTSIQIVQAISAIANGGNLISPRIVIETEENGKKEKVKIKPGKKIISKKTASQVKEMMVAATVEGEAQYYAPEGYRIAGKTGTAQIPVAGHYDPNKTIASFVGFAPADDPKFVMLVRFTEPTSSPYGSETAAPTFFDIAEDIFVYLGIGPAN